MSTFSTLIAGIVMAGIQSPSQPLSLNFSQTDVSQVFRAIGLRTGANIVYSGPDKMPITLHLEAGSVEEAVRGAAASAGLSYRKTGRFYVVAKPDALLQALEPYFVKSKVEAAGDSDELAKRIQSALPYAKVTPSGKYLLISAIPEDVTTAKELIADRRAELSPQSSTTRVLRLVSAPAPKVVQVLTTLFPSVKSVAVSEDKLGGLLTISGNELEVEKALAQARDLDDASAVPVTDDEYRVYEIRYSSANTLKQFLSEAMPSVQALIAPGSLSPQSVPFRALTGSGFIQSAGSTATATDTSGADNTPGQQGGVSDRASRSRRLVLHGQRTEIDQAVRLLSQIDVKPQQVKVDVQVIDVSPTDLASTGFDWSWSPFQLENLPAGSSFSSNDGTAAPWQTGVTNPIGDFTWSKIPVRIAAVINGMVQHKTARVMANPSVQVIDNDDANVFIGDTIRAKLSTNSALAGTSTQVAEFNVGIILLFRPRINVEGNVTMRVHPVVSTVSGITDGLPQTSSREAESTVVIKDGETMVIGGLIRDEEVKTMKEIPLLGQLPFIGELFRSRSTDKRKSNVLVLITPHIVKDTDVVDPAKVTQGLKP